MTYTARSGGRERRVRLTLRTWGDDCVIALMHQMEPSLYPPGNWQDLLVNQVKRVCDEFGAFTGQHGEGRSSRVPIPPHFFGTDVDAESVSFKLAPSRIASGTVRNNQYRAIDMAVERCDTGWPRDIRIKVQHRDDQTYIMTNLSASGRNVLIMGRLRSFSGIKREHMRTYTTSRGMLAAKTACPKDATCTCRILLPKIWQYAWVRD